MNFNEKICVSLKMQISISQLNFSSPKKFGKWKHETWKSTRLHKSVLKILQYPAPKYKSLITSRTSEILTLGEKSSASSGRLGSEAIFVKTVEKSKKWQIFESENIVKFLFLVPLCFDKLFSEEFTRVNLFSYSLYFFKINQNI